MSDYSLFCLLFLIICFVHFAKLMFSEVLSISK
nr:MAG TPA: hypothetical protein [Caudoviricetes sp.]DAH91655.1 MAG TPA: hypothetical protein [Caudoviricetes sp.]